MVQHSRPDTSSDLELLSLGDGPELKMIRVTPFEEKYATFSPDGRYIAYQSDESGRREVYIQSLEEGGGRIQLSRSGGDRPPCGRSGEVFFWKGDQLFTSAVQTVPGLEVGEAHVLFSTERHTTGMNREYDVTGDGQRFILTRTPKASKPREIRVVLNWFSELERLAGPGGVR